MELDGVRFGYPTRPGFLGPITVAIGRGEFWAIVGPNGAGKSTLLRLMAGLRRPDAGRVALEGEPLASLSIRERARRIAFVPQHPPSDFDLTARDIVLMGRFPHRSMALFESPGDRRIAERAMMTTETLPFADRPMATLSGGEAQRVHVAAALAQEPQLLLFDEPTASLDLQHQLAIFQVLRDRAGSRGDTVVVVTHDVNLAAQFCSRILLLAEGRLAAVGSPLDVLTSERLGPVYGVELATLTWPTATDRRWVVPVDAGWKSDA